MEKLAELLNTRPDVMLVLLVCGVGLAYLVIDTIVGLLFPPRCPRCGRRYLRAVRPECPYCTRKPEMPGCARLVSFFVLDTALSWMLLGMSGDWLLSGAFFGALGTTAWVWIRRIPTEEFSVRIVVYTAIGAGIGVMVASALRVWIGV